MKHVLIASIAAAAVCGSTLADSVIINGLGGPVTMNSFSMDILENAPSVFSDADMDSVHDSLHASGIVTDKRVTFVLLNTAAGLTFATLVDDPNASGSSSYQSTLNMSTTAPSSTDWYVNESQDVDQVLDPYNITTTIEASFRWAHRTDADGFAWANLDAGDSSAFEFERGSGSGLINAPFQFASWNGSSWELVACPGWDQCGQFAFCFTVVPLPAALALGAAGLGGVIALRRRKH